MNINAVLPQTIRLLLAGTIVLTACQKQPSNCVEDGHGCDNGQTCCNGVYSTETTSYGHTTCTCGSAPPQNTSGPNCSPNGVSITAQPTAIRDTSSVVVKVTPRSGDCTKVPDGTVVELTLLDDEHTGSTLSANSATTLGSQATVTLNAGNAPGAIIITAQVNEILCTKCESQVSVVIGPFALKLVGASDPSRAPSGFVADSLVVDGATAYVGGWNGFQIIDISNPVSPQNVYSLRLDAYPEVADVAVGGGDFFLLYNGGLLVANSTTGPPDLAWVGSIPVSAKMDSYALSVQGPFGYVATDADHISTVDISDPAKMSIVTTFGEFSVSLFASGSYLYAVTMYAATGGFPGDFQVYDVSDPVHPIKVGALQPGAISDTIVRVYVVGGYAYVATYGGALHIVDVGNPSLPRVVGSVDVCDATHVLGHSLYVEGQYAYLIGHDSIGVGEMLNLLYAVDISHPDRPYVAGRLAMTKDPADGLFVAGKYIYLGGSPSLKVVEKVEIGQ